MKEQENNQWFDELRRQHLKGATRNPGAAALMSFFVMGLGQIYAGHIDRGIMLMAIYFGGIFSAFSVYNGGIVHNAVVPLLGAHLMVIISYFFSVVFILLWIYNIKDAYYLSLFSSFRDWFEVERVLLPVLQNTSGSLIAGPSSTAGLLTHSEESVAASEPAKKIVRAHEDADVVEVSPVMAKDAVKDPDKDVEDDETLEPGQVTYSADFGAMRMHSQSWKLYLGLAAIFILVGIWLEKRGERIESEQNTLFAVAAEIPSGRHSARQLVADLAAAVQVADQVVAPATAVSQQHTASAVAVPESRPLPDSVPTVVPETSPAAVEPEPAIVVSPFAEGMEFVKSGDYSSAAAFFATALGTAEPDKVQWRVILNSFYRAEAMADYEKYLRRYLETFSDDAAAWFNLGKMLYDRSELAQAAQAIVRGLRSEPDNVRGNFLLGSIYIDLKLFNESVTYLEKALALEPLNVECNRQLARALNASGKAFEARRYFQRILSLVPDDLEASQALAGGQPADTGNGDARVLIVQGKGEGRLVEKQAVAIPEAPVSGKVLFDASVGQTVNTPPSAVPLPVSPPSPAPVQVAVAPVLQIESKKAPDAPVTPPPPVPEKIPDDPSAVPGDLPRPAGVELYNRPENKQQNNTDAAPAVPVQPIVVQAVPAAIVEKNAVPPAQTAEVKPVKAKDADDGGFMNAVAQEPDQQSVRRKIEEFRKKGATEFSRGNWEAALPHYLEVLRHKKDAQTYDMIGVIFEKLSMHKDAFDAIEHSYQLGRRDSVTLTRLGRLAETTGNYVKGEKYLQQALQKSPHRIDLRIRYAKCLEENGNRGKAIAELEKIARAGGDSYALKRRAELEISRIRSSGK
ncbi:hypothetical protein MASR1M12_25000 [Erysipelotrichia bacterium]